MSEDVEQSQERGKARSIPPPLKLGIAMAAAGGAIGVTTGNIATGTAVGVVLGAVLSTIQQLRAARSARARDTTNASEEVTSAEEQR